MKLVFLISSLGAGGAERVVTLIANHLVGLNFKVSIITFDSDKKDFYKLNSYIDRHCLNLTMKSGGLFDSLVNTFKRIKKIRCVLKKIQPSIIVSFLDKTNSLAVLSNSFLPSKVFISDRSNPNIALFDSYLKSLLWKFVRKITYCLADGLVVQTNASKHYFVGKVGVRNVEAIPNPVGSLDLMWSNNFDQKIAKFFAFSHKIVALGRLSPEKGFDLLLKAFEIVKSEEKNVALGIIGDGPLAQSLISSVSELDLNQRVFFFGRRENPFPILARSSCFVLSSRFEGFPNSLLEAQSLGLPCVAFNCSYGPSDIIEDGFNGLLVEPENPVLLARAILKVLKDPLLAKKISKNAKKASERFNLHNVCELWLNFILKGSIS
jgi:glycosyltransferase involved in cell wall biosynthesis